MTADVPFSVTPESIEELSLAQLAREVGCHPRRIRRLLEAGEVRGAYQTEGGEKGLKQWRIPRGMWAAYVAGRAVRESSETARRGNA